MDDGARKRLFCLYSAQKCGMDSKTVRRFKANDNVETKTINKLCSALGYKVDDIMQFIED